MRGTGKEPLFKNSPLNRLVDPEKTRPPLLRPETYNDSVIGPGGDGASAQKPQQQGDAPVTPQRRG